MSSRPSVASSLPAELPPARCQQAIERGALLTVLLLVFSLDLPLPLRLAGLLVLALAAARWRPVPAALQLLHDEGLGLCLREGEDKAVALAGCRLHWLGSEMLLVRLQGADGRRHVRVLCGRDFSRAPVRLLKRLSWPARHELTLK